MYFVLASLVQGIHAQPFGRHCTAAVPLLQCLSKFGKVRAACGQVDDRSCAGVPGRQRSPPEKGTFYFSFPGGEK